MRDIERNQLLSVDEEELFGVAEPLSPERRLLHAILERAIRDYLAGAPEDVAQAEEWLNDDGEGSEDEPFSFRWLCDNLSLHPVQVRQRLQGARQEMRRGQLSFFLDKRFPYAAQVAAGQ